jgi:hypothetical protein
VVQEYLQICKEIGVDINLNKSLISDRHTIEFAKRFFTSKGDATPISLGEVMVANISVDAMIGLIRKLEGNDYVDFYIRRGKPMASTAVAFYGYKFRTMGALDAK